jgi:hypothetical protein
MPSNVGSDTDFFRPLLGSYGFYRIETCPFYLLDQGSIGQGSDLYFADFDGRIHGVATEDDSQKMTPSVGDPRQAKMMMLMPIVFTFLFLSFPAGLVLYWLVTNLLTISQQYLINRIKK